MKKLAFVFLIFAAVYSAQAQKRFELDVTTKLGYYFPVNELGLTDKYFPENAFSPGAGVSLGYTFFKSTAVFLGMEYSYLSPNWYDLSDHKLDVTWNSFNVPLTIEQGIGKNFFVIGGVTMVRQLKGYYEAMAANSMVRSQEIPEYNWQMGAGYKLKDLRISLQYSRGFKEIIKSSQVSENEWYHTKLIHQEVFVKLEYPLWKF